MIDERGVIELVCNDEVKSVFRIYSKGGSVRSNHYHKTDWHILYVISGCMEYYERPVGSDRKPARQILLPGERIKTGPMMEHTTVFPVDTVALCLSGSNRDKESYEQDLVRTQDLSAL